MPMAYRGVAAGDVNRCLMRSVQVARAVARPAVLVVVIVVVAPPRDDPEPRPPIATLLRPRLDRLPRPHRPSGPPDPGADGREAGRKGHDVLADEELEQRIRER